MAAAGSSSSDKASLGSAMDSVLSQFDSRVSMLKSLLSLRDLTASPASALSSLEALDMEISALEVEVTSVRSAILSESQSCARLRLRKRAERTAAELHDMSSNLPALLPGDACDAASGSTRMPLRARCRDRRREPPNGGGAAAAAAAAALRVVGPANAPRCRPPPPPLSLVTEAEFGSAPQYMRSRLDAKVNAALAEVQKCCKVNTRSSACRPGRAPAAGRRAEAPRRAQGRGGRRRDQGLYFSRRRTLRACRRFGRAPTARPPRHPAPRREAQGIQARRAEVLADPIGEAMWPARCGRPT